MLEHVDKLAETSAKAIANIKFDKVIVWDNGGGNGTGGNTAHFLQSLVRSMPPMMHVLQDIGGVQLPEYLARLKTEPPNGATSAPTAAAPSTPPAG